jgi:hypothetical protein
VQAQALAQDAPGADDRLRPGSEELRLMAKINLLPWRAERRKQRQKQFYSMLAASASWRCSSRCRRGQVLRHRLIESVRMAAQCVTCTSEIAEARRSASRKSKLLDKQEGRLLARKRSSKSSREPLADGASVRLSWCAPFPTASR